jgi:hypothetical protein
MQERQCVAEPEQVAQGELQEIQAVVPLKYSLEAQLMQVLEVVRW